MHDWIDPISARTTAFEHLARKRAPRPRRVRIVPAFIRPLVRRRQARSAHRVGRSVTET